MSSQSDTGDKLGSTIPCAGGGAALRIYCCMREENCSCMAGGNSAIPSELIVDVTVLVTGMELLIEVEVGTVILLAESVVVVGVTPREAYRLE